MSYLGQNTPAAQAEMNFVSNELNSVDSRLSSADSVLYSRRQSLSTQQTQREKLRQDITDFKAELVTLDAD